jgi:DNA-binding GntR family transcriptional regulator
MTAQEAALLGLREQIRSGELAPGQRVDQRRAAEELECSIVPVREALQTLEAEGQVYYSPQRGYFVADLDADELVEVYRIRALLEEEAIRAAVPRIDADALRVLQILLDEWEEAAAAGLVAELIAADRRLHLTLYAFSGMNRLVGLVRMLWDSTDRYRARFYTEPGQLERSRDEHRAIVAAVGEHDAEAVIRLLAVHRGHVLDGMRAMLDGAAKPS